MNSEQLERIKTLNAEGRTTREIAEETGIPQRTVSYWVGKVAQEVAQGPEQVAQGPKVAQRPEDIYIPKYPTPKELQDLKEAGVLDPDARIGPAGELEVSDGAVLWPAWEPTGEKKVGVSKQTTNLMRPLRPRPARRGTDVRP